MQNFERNLSWFMLQDDYALGWVNLNLFDFNGRLQNEKFSLHLWPIPEGHEDLLYPIGVPGKSGYCLLFPQVVPCPV